MKKELKTLSDLKAAEYNPRTISPSALKGLGYSLEEFGDLSGIVFNKKTGNLVCGHQRVTALQEKYGNAPIEDNILKANGHAFPIRIVDWPRDKEIAANIAANTPEIQGEFTIELQDLLSQVETDLPELFENLKFDALKIEEFDPNEHWQGMREFKQESLAHRTIYIHFENEEDIKDFSRLLNQKITNQTKYLWFPEKERRNIKDYNFKNES